MIDIDFKFSHLTRVNWCPRNTWPSCEILSNEWYISITKKRRRRWFWWRTRRLCMCTALSDLSSWLRIGSYLSLMLKYKSAKNSRTQFISFSNRKLIQCRVAFRNLSCWTKTKISTPEISKTETCLRSCGSLVSWPSSLKSMASGFLIANTIKVQLFSKVLHRYAHKHSCTTGSRTSIWLKTSGFCILIPTHSFKGRSFQWHNSLK